MFVISENSMKKYTNRLKLLIFKHFPRGFEVKAGHLGMNAWSQLAY